MFKVLVVDDEPFIRMGLKKMINWEEEGFSIVAEARNGEEALNIINDEKVDLIITDISMPKVDGIAFINELRKQNNHTKVVFLTGFKEFEYAKQGIRLEVKEYLLKPINPKELLEVLKNIRSLLEEEYRFEKIVEEVNNKKIIDIIQGKNKDLDLLNNYFTKTYVNVCKVEVENFDSIGEEWIRTGQYYINVKNIKEELEDIIKEKIKFVEGELGNYYIVIENDNNTVNLDYIIGSLNERLLKSNIKCNVTLGKWVKLEEVYLSYKKIRKESNSKIESEKITVKKKISNINILSKEDQGQLIKYVIEGNSRAFEIVEMIKVQSIESNIDRYLLSLTLQNIVETILDKIRTQYGYVNKLFLVKDYDYFYKDKDFTNEELVTVFSKTINELLNVFGNFKIAYKDSIIRQACQFVVKNIDKDVSLSMVADELKISKNYFCTLFKNETGENFLTFVTRTKMERAKILLKNENMKVYEVCDYLGYNDTTYFTRLFKKYTDMTPYEYKKIGG